MELKEFVNNTLTQLAEGVQEAIDASKGKGYWVSPGGKKFGQHCVVHFDLSVESGKEGKASINVLGGNINEKITNRIKFDVHMDLPFPNTSSLPPDRKKPEEKQADHIKTE